MVLPSLFFLLPQPQRGQRLLSLLIFLFQQVVNIPINIHHQPCLVEDPV
jgi:hypothetical protein